MPRLPLLNITEIKHAVGKSQYASNADVGHSSHGKSLGAATKDKGRSCNHNGNKLMILCSTAS